MPYFPYVATVCPPCQTVDVPTCQSPCGAPGFPFPPFPNEVFTGYSAKPYIFPTGIPVFKFDFTNRFSNCCGNPITFTSGAQTFVVPAGELLGQFSFPLPLVDGAVVTVTYTECGGFVETIPAYRAFLTDGCATTPQPLIRLCEHWTIQACSLCPCDCSIPANIEVDFGEGFQVVATLMHDGGIYPAPGFGFKQTGRQMWGMMTPQSGECFGSTQIMFHPVPGFSPTTPIRLVFFPGQPNEQRYAFKPLGCDNPADIVNICLPCNGGGTVPCPTITGTFPLVITPLAQGCGYVASMDPSWLNGVDTSVTIVQNMHDAVVPITPGQWIPLGPGLFQATVVHNLNLATVVPPTADYRMIPSGNEFMPMATLPNTVNSFFIQVSIVPAETIEVNVEYRNV